MNFSGGASTRQPTIESPEQGLSVAPAAVETPDASENTVKHLRLLWAHRRLLWRALFCAVLASSLVAFLIPSRYESSVRLMPPDSSPTSSLMMAAMASGAGGLGTIANDLLGLKSTSDVFVGILTSHSEQDKLIEQFNPKKKLYGDRRIEDARDDLAKHTGISVDRKSEIIAIAVIDKSPQRAAAMAQAYVEELDRLVADLSTSSARRERIFLEQRLQAVGNDLESAEKQFSQFASKNEAIDIKEQGSAMVRGCRNFAGRIDRRANRIRRTQTDLQ